MVLTPAEIARHGGTRPLPVPHSLDADPFTAGLEAPSVRNVAIDGFEVAQTITFTVRDRNWDTIESDEWVTSLSEENGLIRVDMEGRFTSEEIDLQASVCVRTVPNGSFVYSAKATALRNFERARIGICVMHPADLTGRQLHVTTPSNSYSTVFPTDISASRAITDIVTLRHEMESGREVLFEFEGDLFEFEDQRNWADASYKTFCTPLRLPRPVSVRSGDEIEQRLRISCTGAGTSYSSPPLDSHDTKVHIDLDAAGLPVPSLGVLSDIEPESIAAVLRLGVPHVRFTLDTRSNSAAADLVAIGRALKDSNTQVELEIVCNSPAEVRQLHEELVQMRDRIQRIFVFDRESQITTTAYAPAINDLRSLIGPRVGGGSGSNFGQINFNMNEVAFDSLDVLTFPMSPQTHYTDHFSFLTNLDAQADVAANGRRLARHRELSIGPITLLPRRAGEPPAPDPRSGSLLAAAWTVASLNRLMTSGADALTYHRMGDPTGIMTHDRSLTPIYHLLADLAGYSAAHSLRVYTDSPRFKIATIALRRPSDALIVVASLEPEPIDIGIALPPVDVRIRTLDETTYDLALRDRKAFIDTTVPWMRDGLRLLPFAVSTLEVTY